jgi:putative heme-binding domain-containing protein
LIHAGVVEEQGSMFQTSRFLERREFLASKDSWFRPVQLYIGPDGALYLIDYYRRIIEHPQWMDEEVIETVDLYESTNRGRIYRIIPEDSGTAEWTSNLSLIDQSAAELVQHLESSNIWWRRTAQRLLLDRNDSGTIEPLKKLVVESEKATARLHALWTLDGLGALESSLIKHALEDPEPGVRENAIRLSEKQLQHDSALAEKLLELVDDPSLRVRYQLLLTLGDFTAADASEIRDRLLLNDIEDEWMQIAYLSAMEVDGDRLLSMAMEHFSGEETAGRVLFFSRLSAVISRAGDVAEIRSLLRESLSGLDENSSWWKSAMLDGLRESLPNLDLDRSEFELEIRQITEAFFETDNEQVRSSLLSLIEFFGFPEETKEDVLEQVVAIAMDMDEQSERRSDAVRLISLFSPEQYEEELKTLSSPQQPTAVQQEAVTGLGNISGIDVAEFLLGRWDTMTPAVRNRAADALMRNEERIMKLLDAVENGRVLVSSIGWNRQVVLMRDTDIEIRERARELLTDDSTDRDELFERYRDVAEISGDPDRGKDVFLASCSACHQAMGNHGVEFGPDLGTVRHWTPRSLLSKILDPNRSISDGYEMWIVERSAGPSVAGVIAGETQNSVTLINAGGVETTIPRSEIKDIRASNVSAMPAGLEYEIDPRQMADLIAYIRQL